MNHLGLLLRFKQTWRYFSGLPMSDRAASRPGEDRSERKLLETRDRFGLLVRGILARVLKTMSCGNDKNDRGDSDDDNDSSFFFFILFWVRFRFSGFVRRSNLRTINF